MRNSFPPSSGHRPPSTHYKNHNRNQHYHPPNYHQRHHNNNNNSNNNHHPLGPTNSPSRPPPLLRPNFIIQLLSPTPLRKPDLDSLISTCKPSPDNSAISSTTASLHFRQWCDALSCLLHFWALRLNGSHSLTPKLISNVLVPSDTDELADRMKILFTTHLKTLTEGELVINWTRKLDKKLDEIADVSNLLKSRNTTVGFSVLNEKKKGLVAERDLIAKRVREFKAVINCILGYLQGEECDAAFAVLRIDGGYDWERIFHLILRECRRLEDGLPIYAFRQDILNRIHGEQVYIYMFELSDK